MEEPPPPAEGEGEGPTQLPEPVEPDQSIEPNEPIEPEGTTESVEHTEPAEPTVTTYWEEGRPCRVVTRLTPATPIATATAPAAATPAMYSVVTRESGRPWSSWWRQSGLSNSHSQGLPFPSFPLGERGCPWAEG